MPDVKPKVTRKASPSWSDVKAKLTDFDRAGLIGLVQVLYVASKDNQAFLHVAEVAQQLVAGRRALAQLKEAA